MLVEWLSDNIKSENKFVRISMIFMVYRNFIFYFINVVNLSKSMLNSV